jgi:hypothetical protein
MNGKANWQTGQEILKNIARTGPRVSASLRENSLPSKLGRVKSGAGVPAVSADIFFPPNRFLKKVMRAKIF